MKKMLAFALTAVLSASLFAEETAPDKNTEKKAKEQETVRVRESSVWPAYIAVSQWPRSADVIGLRVTVPFSTSQESVTGFDLGLWGHSIYFEGIQVNVLRNDVVDTATGVQVGIYNSVGSGCLLGLQAGLWNESASIVGAQVGLVNVTGQGEGFQFGLINRAETMHGYQVGVINVIRDAELRFCPIVNIGF